MQNSKVFTENQAQKLLKTSKTFRKLKIVLIYQKQK